MTIPKATEEQRTVAFAMQSVFDKAAALARADGDIAFLRELVGVFLQDAVARASAIRDAIAQADHPALERAAHSLKAAAASIGATRVARAAQRLEEVAHEHDLAQADAAAAVLQAALDRLRPALAELLRGGDDDADAGTRSVPSASTAAPTGHACVLVIDDDPTVRLATRQALLVAGFDVLTAETGNEGLRMAGEARPDLVLLDVVLAGDNGLDVCRRIKADPALADIPVLMASAARTSSASRTDGLEAGADGYIVRPVETHELVAWVRAMLRIKTAEEERTRLAARLRQAEKLEAIGRLAGGVAHDFNNQLMVIKGHLQFLLKGLAAADPCRTDAERADITVDKCAGLVRQLLTFSRHEPLETSVIELNALVTEMVPLLHVVLGAQINVRLRAAPALHHIRADRGQMKEALMNLAGNARDAMTASGAAVGGTLTLETANVEAEEFARHVVGGQVAPGPYVMLTVSDNGVGMPPEVVERIFEPFFTTKEVGKGTGLGLATVFGIVKQHHGHIACDSAPGRGTAFRLYFPGLGHEGAAPTGPRPAVPPQPRDNTGQRTTLVVEDERNLRELLVQALERAGYRVYAAANAREALAVAGTINGSLDVLVTDLVMPGDSGPTLARRLRCDLPHLGVLLISGYTPNTLDLSDLPGARFLQKPFGLDELAHAVRAVVPR